MHVSSSYSTATERRRKDSAMTEGGASVSKSHAARLTDIPHIAKAAVFANRAAIVANRIPRRTDGTGGSAALEGGALGEPKAARHGAAAARENTK